MNERITEENLLEWIEGEASAELSAEVERALDADPKLRAWATALSSDRELIQQWGREAEAGAPVGLGAEAIAEVERRALLGEPEPVAGPALMRLTRGRVIGIAAAVALIATGALFLPPILQQQSAPGAPVGIADGLIADAQQDESGMDAGAKDKVADERGADSLALAEGAPAISQPAEKIESLAQIPEIVAVSGDADQVVGGASEPADVADEIELALDAPESLAVPALDSATVLRATKLAQQHRLAILVESDDVEALHGRVRSLASATTGLLRWTGANGERVRLPFESYVASMNPEDAQRLSGFAPGEGGTVGGYHVELAVTQEGIASLLAGLQEASGRGVRVIELETPREAPSPRDARDVLWWGQPVSRWLKRASVPVLVGGWGGGGSGGE